MEKILYFIKAYNLNTMSVDCVGHDVTKAKAVKRKKELEKNKNYTSFEIIKDTVNYT